MQWVEALLEALPEDADVLELGCGGGSAATRTLARRHRLTGVDLSSAQLERARRAVPDARFVHRDASAIELDPASFDAVVSLFMFGHIPRGEQARLLCQIARWLRPAGHALVTFGVGDIDDDVEADWLGAPMFFASFDPDTNRAMIAAAGFEILRDRIVPIDEPGHGPVSFQWVLARKLRRAGTVPDESVRLS
jgi:SAM-dependent methyltransferase